MDSRKPWSNYFSNFRSLDKELSKPQVFPKTKKALRSKRTSGLANASSTDLETTVIANDVAGPARGALRNPAPASSSTSATAESPSEPLADPIKVEKEVGVITYRNSIFLSNINSY